MQRSDIDLDDFKEKLEQEKETLLGELKTLGQRNPANPADWVPTPPSMDIDAADRNETADKIEGYEENSAILKELETRYQSVKDALTRIEGGTYGVCDVGGEPIEKERLEANPAATTCITHRDSH